MTKTNALSNLKVVKYLLIVFFFLGLLGLSTKVASAGVITNICGLPGNSCNGSTSQNENGISFPINWKDNANNSCGLLKNSSFYLSCNSGGQCPNGTCTYGLCDGPGDPCGAYCVYYGGSGGVDVYCDNPQSYGHGGRVDIYGSKTDAGIGNTAIHCDGGTNCAQIYVSSNPQTLAVTPNGTVMVKDWTTGNTVWSDSGYCRVQLDVYDNIMGGSPTDFIVWRDPTLCQVAPPTCGNGTCDPGETCGSCPADCGSCCVPNTCAGTNNCGLTMCGNSTTCGDGCGGTLSCSTPSCSPPTCNVSGPTPVLTIDTPTYSASSQVSGGPSITQTTIGKTPTGTNSPATLATCASSSCASPTQFSTPGTYYVFCTANSDGGNNYSCVGNPFSPNSCGSGGYLTIKANPPSFFQTFGGNVTSKGQITDIYLTSTKYIITKGQ